MKVVLLIAVVLAINATALTDTENQWNQFKLKHGKIYKNIAEETNRFKIFQDNLLKISEHNVKYDQGIKTYKLGVNKFADISHEEFKSMLRTQRKTKPQETKTTFFKAPEGAEIPASLDWRDSGAVTEIKDQGACGSCWAFSAAASFEGQYYFKNNELIDFSVQQIVDCSDWDTYGNDGCYGGEMTSAFQYIADNGIEKWDDYPYYDNQFDCGYNQSLVVARGSGYVEVPTQNEEDLKAAVASFGPLSLGINGDDIQLYEYGVFNDYCSEFIDHGVLLVGYGSTDDGDEYWIIKNSWGSDWGEKGYLILSIGDNLCCVSCEVSYPTL